MKKLIALTLIVVSLVVPPALSTEAQEESCPSDLVCIEWQDNTIQVDPECGPVQAIITEDTLVRTRSLEGETESLQVTGLVLVKVEDKYEVVGIFTEPAEETLEGVEFGSVGCLQWDVEDD